MSLVETRIMDGRTIWVDGDIVVTPLDLLRRTVYVVSDSGTWVDGVYETKEGAARAPYMDVDGIARLAKKHDVITDAHLDELERQTS